MVREETSSKNEALELEALELRILNAALSQRLTNGTDEAERLGEYARIIAAEAPAQVDQSYILGLQSRLCLALNTIDQLRSRQSGIPDRISFDGQGQRQEKRGSEEGSIAGEDNETAIESVLMKREIDLLHQESNEQMQSIANLQYELTRTKEKMTDSMSFARSSRSLPDFSLADDEQEFVVAGAAVDADEAGEVNDEMMGSIASLQYDLVFAKEKLNDAKSFTRSHRSSRSLTDLSSLIPDENESDEMQRQMDSIASIQSDLASAKERLNDALAASNSSRNLRRTSNESDETGTSSHDLTNGNQEISRAARAPRRSVRAASSASAAPKTAGVSANGTPITGPLERRNFTGRTA